MMEYAMVLTAAALIITKVADILTTWFRITSWRHEANPIAQVGMRRIGVGGTCLVVMALSVIIVLVAYQLALWQGPVWQFLFTIVGLGISVVQLSVACANATGRQNDLTRSLLKMFLLVPQIRFLKKYRAQ